VIEKCRSGLVIFLLLGLAALVVGSSSAGAATLPAAPDDPFFCYKAKATKGTPKLSAFDIGLSDPLDGAGTFSVKKQASVCVPANADAAGITNDEIHLEAYQLKSAKGEPKHEKQQGLLIENAFGTISVDTIKADRLLVATALDAAAPVPAPDSSMHNVDALKCYKVKVSKGTPKLTKGTQSDVAESFEARRYDLKKPTRLCLAADLEDGGVKNRRGHLLCYQAKVAKRTIAQPPAAGDKGATISPKQPKHTRRTGLFVANEFGSEQLDTKKEEELCVPSVISGATAREIVDSADLMTGPLAHGQVGDYLLENNVARFIIQAAPRRDFSGVAQFGGNLIDAERWDRPGLENFMELQPAIHIESVVNAQTIEIVNDGADGTPAIVRTCGPDDLLDYINPSTLVDELSDQTNFPPAADDADFDLEACTEYRLAAGASHLEIETTVFNMESNELALYVGDFVNGGGELEQWTGPGGGVADENTGVGEMLVTNTFNVFSYYGFGDAEGVDYSLVPIPLPGEGRSSSFTQSGVSAVLHSTSVLGALVVGSPPVFIVPPAASGVPGTNSFSRAFGVGDGSGGNALDLDFELSGAPSGTLRGCVTVGGNPAPGARIAVGEDDGAGALQQVRSHFVADGDGCYEGRLVPGDYLVAAGKLGVPYEGGGAAPATHPVAIVVDDVTELDIALPATGRVEVTVADGAGAPLPARVTVVGFDPSPEVRFPFDITGINLDSQLLHDTMRDDLSFGIVWIEYTDASGAAAFDLEPGDYQLFFSRGTEYSQTSTAVSIAADFTTSVNATIAKVIDTPGFVSSDFHVHQIASSDSRISLFKRVLQFAGEGVDNIIATDHDRHTDLNPEIAAQGLEPFVHATVGEEITTFDYGHYNAYPLGIDATQPSGGSTDWGQPPDAPGTDFPSFGSYTATPAEIHALVLDDPINESPDVAVQINHFDSHFGPLKIDTGVVPPQSFLTADDLARRRFDPASGNLFHEFDALEVWNGYSRGHQNEFLGGRIGVWMNLLNQGIATTAIFDTDTHGFFNTRGGGARSWTPSVSDDASEIVDDTSFDNSVGNAVNAGRVVGGQGVYVQAAVRAVTGGETADFSLDGSTLVSASDGLVELDIHVQAPTWAPYDRIEIYRNASTCEVGDNDGVPVAYTAIPSDVLDKDAEFTRDLVVVDPGVVGANRFETTVTLPFVLAADTWFVVLVRGTDGLSEPMFPVMPASLASGSNATLPDLLDGNLDEGGVLALGATNALYVDFDGGGFDGPGPLVIPCP